MTGLQHFLRKIKVAEFTIRIQSQSVYSNESADNLSNYIRATHPVTALFLLSYFPNITFLVSCQFQLRELYFIHPFFNFEDFYYKVISFFSLLLVIQWHFWCHLRNKAVLILYFFCFIFWFLHCRCFPVILEFSNFSETLLLFLQFLSVLIILALLSPV